MSPISTSLAAALLATTLFATATAEPLPGEYPLKKPAWKREGNEQAFTDYKKTILDLMALPPEKVTAHPAATDFPGVPAADSKKITREVPMDTKIPRWHSTGLYAAPGTIVTVEVPPDAANAKLGVRIGCHQDKLWSEKIKSWTRVPEISRLFPVTEKSTPVANAFGGLIYIVVPPDCKLGEIKVTVRDAIPAPLFVAGKTDPVAWKKEIRDFPGPWAELAGKNLVISLPSENIRKLDDPAAVIAFWDKVVAAEDDLAGTTANRTSPERFVLDRQISAGYMHSGYPIMAWLDQAPKVANMDELKKGSWGFFHELGHNHQNKMWTPEGTGEVTCNIFSMYCFEKVCGLPRRGHGAMNDASREKQLREFYSNPELAWTSNPFLALNFYDQLVEGFGWDTFKKVFLVYRDMPEKDRPKTNPERLDEWLIHFSKATGKDLGPFFVSWRIPVSEAALKKAQGPPVWMPETDYPKRYQTP
ncbi:MAG: M60 family metallopeptidase [Luteolibacter sp.]|uniref:M60 family metallopeptidase n=1 Tax=Luteolibacter sp. TaxID=1962973 RepID=UPI003265A297